MTDPILERALAILADAPAVTVPVADLARSAGAGDPDAFARRLGADPRVLLLDPPPLPGLELIPEDRRAAYRRALTAAGLLGERRVALLRPRPSSGDAGAPQLLRETAVLLLARGSAGTGAVERVHRAVTAALRGP